MLFLSRGTGVVLRGEPRYHCKFYSRGKLLSVIDGINAWDVNCAVIISNCSSLLLEIRRGYQRFSEYAKHHFSSNTSLELMKICTGTYYFANAPRLINMSDFREQL